MGNKIYGVLRKYASQHSKALHSNSEYFVVGMVEIRVSDHTNSEMSTASPNKMHILISENSKLYTVCYGQSVCICTLSKIKDMLETFTMMEGSFRNLMKYKGKVNLKVEEGWAEWNTVIGSSDSQDFIKLLEDEGYSNLKYFSKSEIKKLKAAFMIPSLKSFQEKKDAVLNQYKNICHKKESEIKKDITKLKPSLRVLIITRLTGESYMDLKVQHRTYVGMVMANIFNTLDDINSILFIINKLKRKIL